jgi:hypothetical protein
VLFPCIYVLQPPLIHPSQSSSLLPSLLPMMAPASLRFLYSFLYSKHINLIQVFGFLPLLYPSLAQPPLVWPMFHNIVVFVLGLQSAYEGEHEGSGLLSLANFT